LTAAATAFMHYLDCHDLETTLISISGVTGRTDQGLALF